MVRGDGEGGVREGLRSPGGGGSAGDPELSRWRRSV